MPLVCTDNPGYWPRTWLNYRCCRSVCQSSPLCVGKLLRHQTIKEVDWMRLNYHLRFDRLTKMLLCKFKTDPFKHHCSIPYVYWSWSSAKRQTAGWDTKEYFKDFWAAHGLATEIVLHLFNGLSLLGWRRGGGIWNTYARLCNWDFGWQMILAITVLERNSVFCTH